MKLHELTDLAHKVWGDRPGNETPFFADLERFAALVAERDTALLRQALDCLENHVMQRTYAGGVVICNTAIALRERLALSDAALLAPKPGQLKDRGKR
jgi:hypothetical protein